MAGINSKRVYIINIILISLLFNFLFSCLFVKADVMDLPKIDAKCACVMDLETGRVLFEKNAYVRTPMASTTKIMTAILAIERGNMDDIVTISVNAANTWGSDIKLKAGEQIPLRELIYGLMLKSGNDAAVAIAEYLSGDVSTFAQLMTLKANQIGASNTNFETPHGLDSANHYTTAYDLAKITRYAMHNPIFRQIVSTKEISFGKRQFANTNELLGNMYGVNGVKTGYTGLAGRCLVASATRNDRTYIAVALGSVNKRGRGDSCRKMLEYSFANYSTFPIVGEQQVIAQIPVEKGKQKSLPVVLASASLSVPINSGAGEYVDTKINLPKSFKAPYSANVEVGTMDVFINGKLLCSAKLKTYEAVQRKNFWDFLTTIYEELVNIID